MSKRIISSVMILALVAMAPTGCASWRQQGATVEQVLQAREEPKLRVRVEGFKKRIELKAPWVETDSLHGVFKASQVQMPADWDRSNSKWNAAAIPVSGIKGVEVRRHDSSKTVGLAMGLAVIVAVFVAAALTYDSAGGLYMNGQPLD